VERLERRHPFRQWLTWAMGGLTVTGYSRANDKTFFHVPELKLGLDAGLVEGRQPATVLVTHTHLDHAKDLDFLAARPGGVDIYVPADAWDYVDRHLRATTELNQVAPFDPALSTVRLHGVRAGDEFTMGRHVVRALETHHKVPSVGYCVGEVRRALKAEFRELDGRVIATLRSNGTVVDEVVHHPRFVYTGDTSPDALIGDVFDYPVIITECTFLDDAELARAQRVGHTVWSQLRPIVEAHPENLFVLTHFSLRHSDLEIVEFFEKVKLDNVLVWAAPPG
jgi:ribonuclease Z